MDTCCMEQCNKHTCKHKISLRILVSVCLLSKKKNGIYVIQHHDYGMYFLLLLSCLFVVFLDPPAGRKKIKKSKLRSSCQTKCFWEPEMLIPLLSLTLDYTSVKFGLRYHVRGSSSVVNRCVWIDIKGIWDKFRPSEWVEIAQDSSANPGFLSTRLLRSLPIYMRLCSFAYMWWVAWVLHESSSPLCRKCSIRNRKKILHVWCFNLR